MGNMEGTEEDTKEDTEEDSREMEDMESTNTGSC
jgi:hypothetical protein